MEFAVDERLNEHYSLDLAQQLSLIPTTEDVTLDFSRVLHVEPFGMLITGSAVRNLSARLTTAGRQLIVPAENLNQFAGHMGFWQSIGVNVGRSINAPSAQESYLPISTIDVAELYSESGGANPLASGVIQARADALAKILAPSIDSPLFEALSYIFRELIRNVVEHAMTPVIWIAGQTWSQRDYVQVAVMDEGRGIRESLNSNPMYQFATDGTAIRAAISPGVTRNHGRKLTRAEYDRWAETRSDLPPEFFQNTGYGLFLASTICRAAGQFLIASGNASLAFVTGELESSTHHRGTALRFVLRPSKIKAAMDSAFGHVETAPSKNQLISASKLRRMGLGHLAGNGGSQSSE